MKLTLNQQLMLQQAWLDREEPLEWRTPAGMTEGGVTRAVNALIALGLLTQEKTITEMIYVPNEISDGLYVLNLQIAPFENDASPSKPVLYKVY